MFQAVSPLVSKAESYATLELNALQSLILELAGACHRAMLDRNPAPHEGIILSENYSSGLVAEALSSFDGSSKYLRGALYTPQIDSTARQIERYVLDKKLPGDHVLANEWSKNADGAVSLTVRSAEETSQLLFPFDELTLEHRRHIAAMLTLELFAQQIGADSPATGASFCETSPLRQRAIALKLFNASVWQEDLLPEVLANYDSIVVGESFTFGKLARLFSDARVPVLDTVYGWYDAKYKTAVGVREEQVQESRIALPETVIAGAKGLLNLISLQSTIAIGTSGWANYWQAGEADYFSVACANRRWETNSSNAVHFQVTASQDAPRDFARRDLTRELGVTASLMVLARSLHGNQEDSQVGDKLRQKLLEFGKIIRT